jgi:hypothetical protein
MNALLKLFDGIGVANRAIDPGCYSGARPDQGWVTACMALHASYPGMPRGGKFLIVDE